MNKKNLMLAIAAIITILAIRHFFLKKQELTSENIRPFAFIQLGDHQWILQAQETIKPVIDAIIKDEILKTNPGASNFSEFYLKQRHLITLFYSAEVPVVLESAIIKIFQSISTEIYPVMLDVKFSDHFELFGKDQSELVVKIDDAQGCLARLRAVIIDVTTKNYEELHGKNLQEILSIKAANTFDFAPHETLGRINVEEILKCSDEATVKNIRQRILTEIPVVLGSVTVSKAIQPDVLQIYGNNFKPIYLVSLKH